MKYKELICFLALSIIVVLFSLDVGMFWDNVLHGSHRGSYLFQYGISEWGSIPLGIDNGHPPFLAIWLAAGWKIFGRSLAVSHWLMLPFVFGLVYQLYKFVGFFVKEKYSRGAAFILVLADPTLLSQLVLINPEVIQSFFFFLALNSILTPNRILKIIGLSLLGLVTFRGMMLCAGLFVVDILIFKLIRKQSFKNFFSPKEVVTYLISASPAMLYVIWRLVTKNWLISHPLKIYGDSMEFSSFIDFMSNFGRNILVLGYQFTDFGRMSLLVFILFTLYVKRKHIRWERYNYLILIAIFSTVVIYTVSLVIRNTMGHRYYLVSYLSLALLAFMLLKEYKSKKVIYSILLTSLLAGNFIVYPDWLAQGWDSSLAHLSYWDLRKQMLNYMEAQKIPIAETESFFPNNTSIDDIDLNGDMRSFEYFVGSKKYVFYSNVYNPKDDELLLLHKNYKILKTFTNNNVRVELMEKVKE